MNRKILGARFSLTLLLFSCPLAFCSRQTIIVSEVNARPATMDSLTISLGKQELAIVPGAFAVDFEDGQANTFSLANSTFHRFTMKISSSAGHLTLDSISKDGCPPEQISGALNADAQGRYVLHLTYSIAPNGCRISPSMGPPEGRVKLRFEANPATATLYFKNPVAFSLSQLPSLVSLAYWKGESMTVFFKAKGYLDCPRRILIRKENDQFVVSDEAGEKTTNGEEATAPVISCKMSKIP